MKNFDKWNDRKKTINQVDKYIMPSKRQIWWVSVGFNIGDEEDGKNENFERPVLVIKIFNRKIFLGIPITSADRLGQRYYFPIIYDDKKYFLILSQIRLFSTKRLLRRIGRIDSNSFSEMKKELKKVIGLI